MAGEEILPNELEIHVAEVCAFLDKVSNLENPVAAKPEEVPVDSIKRAFELSGAKTEISLEGQKSLREKQFRNFDTGRGPGVVEVFGRGRVMHYLVWAFEVSKEIGMPKLNRDRSPAQRSRARGLMQFMASIANLATGSQSKEEFIQELNQRAYNGLVVKAGQLNIDPEKINEGFPGFKRNKKVSSAPPGMLSEAFKRMLGM